VVGIRFILQLVGLMMYFESVQFRNEILCGFGWSVFWVHHEQHMRESGAEVTTIGVVVSGTFWGMRNTLCEVM